MNREQFINGSMPFLATALLNLYATDSNKFNVICSENGETPAKDKMTLIAILAKKQAEKLFDLTEDIKERTYPFYEQGSGKDSAQDDKQHNEGNS